MNKNKYIVASLFLLVLALFSRIVPHAPNFTPIISIALFSAIIFKEKKYVMISILGLLLSDVLLEFYHYNGYLFSSLFFLTYGSLAMVFLFAYKFNNKLNLSSIVFHSFFGASIFFVTSNFGVWLLGGYTYTLEGLLACYAMGIPFFKNTLSSTLIYSVILFAPTLYREYILSMKKIYS